VCTKLFQGLSILGNLVPKVLVKSAFVVRLIVTPKLPSPEREE